MWCENCHARFPTWTGLVCPMCGGQKFTEKSPIPNKPTRSIRSMEKRKDVKRDKVTKKEVSTDVEGIMKEAQHRQ